MEFGIFSNGFRPHTTAALTYDEDVREIVLADQLGYRYAYISEHHGEPPYINRVDTLPLPELLMCRAGELTKQIIMGAAVKLIHLQHPLDVAIQAAITDHMLHGRYIFGFGTGFPSPLFSVERGLTYEDRHARQQESLAFILKCWESEAPFDWEGKYWKGKGIVSLPKPYTNPHMRVATATDSEPAIKLAAERGYVLLSAFLEPPHKIRAKTKLYTTYASAAGHPKSLKNIATSRLIYIADSKKEAIEDLRAGVRDEIKVQAERGFLRVMKSLFDVDITPNEQAVEQLVDGGIYVLGNPDEITDYIKKYFDDTGGFGTFLIVAGKNWATPEKRARSMRRFIEEVAPRIRNLDLQGPLD